MQFLNLFCPDYPKHGRIWDIGQDKFYCSNQQHDQEGTTCLWTGAELIAAHNAATTAKQQSQTDTTGSPTESST
jgi:hypothetical protein